MRLCTYLHTLVYKKYLSLRAKYEIMFFVLLLPHFVATLGALDPVVGSASPRSAICSLLILTCQNCVQILLITTSHIAIELYVVLFHLFSNLC